MVNIIFLVIAVELGITFEDESSYPSYLKLKVHWVNSALLRKCCQMDYRHLMNMITSSDNFVFNNDVKAIPIDHFWIQNSNQIWWPRRQYKAMLQNIVG